MEDRKLTAKEERKWRAEFKTLGREVIRPVVFSRCPAGVEFTNGKRPGVRLARKCGYPGKKEQFAMATYYYPLIREPDYPALPSARLGRVLIKPPDRRCARYPLPSELRTLHLAE